MLRKIRRLIAALVFILVTLLFLDFTGTLHVWFGWLAKVQLVPAILALNAVVIVSLVALTLIFGRLYCSVICPLGIMQDGISYISAKRKRKKNRFRYSKAKNILRYSILVVFIASFFATIPLIFTTLDSYSAYGRIAAELLAPVYRLGNNLLASISESIDSYAFYSTDVYVKSGITLGIAVITLLVTGILAWLHGRTYCNTICPVGTLLGLMSRFSVFKPVFNNDKCNGCGLCERNCKASCIDSKNRNIDYSRCVTCFNCIDKCKSGAMKYTPSQTKKTESLQKENTEKKNNMVSTAENKDGFSRRSFLSVAGMVAIAHTVKAQQLHVDGGLAEVEDKKISDRNTSIVPPGAGGSRHMNIHCTACQLCVSSCPNHILRPSSKMATFMQPEISYERGYCRPECTECSQVCPTGAIKPIDTALKSSISIGHAIWIKDNCIVNRDEVQCNNCEYHCPTNAITMVERKPGLEDDKLKVPVIDKEICIGCGACEYLCPARPFSAIYVEGNIRHHSI